MLEKVKEWCDRQGLLCQGDAILIACSGGPDSLALADIMLRLQPAYGLRLAVAHLDHMLRGAAAQADAAFVQAFCAAHMLPFYSRRADVAAYAAAQGLSLEDAARSVRYDFLRAVAAKLGGAKIATGHHCGDQAETVLLHLLRGAGSSGIAGIRAVSCGIIRPFLSLSRREIEMYCEQRALQPRCDATNADTRYLRNKVRLRLLPALEREYNTEIEAALCRTAELVGAEHDFIRQCAEARWAMVASPDAPFALRRSALLQQHLALRRELLRLAIEKLRGHVRGMAFFHIERMLRFAETGRSGTMLELPEGVRLQCVYDELRFFLAEENAAGHTAASALPIAVPGKTAAAAFGVRFETALLSSYRRPRDGCEIICDLERLHLPLYVRIRKNGDRFFPSGMKGGKKLKDFFIDCKVERTRRDRIPLVCDQKGIVWVAGLRQSQMAVATVATKQFLLLTMKKDMDEKEYETK